MFIISKLRYVANSLLNIYKLKYLLYKRLTPAPPLLINGLLFLLAIIILAGVFKDYSIIKDVLAARSPPRRKFRIIKWADGVLNDLVFSEMFVDRPTKKTKTETA
jgi:hypothetical protein